MDSMDLGNVDVSASFEGDTSEFGGSAPGIDSTTLGMDPTPAFTAGNAMALTAAAATLVSATYAALVSGNPQTSYSLAYGVAAAYGFAAPDISQAVLNLAHDMALGIAQTLAADPNAMAAYSTTADELAGAVSAVNDADGAWWASQQSWNQSWSCAGNN